MTDTYCMHCMQKKSAAENICAYCHSPTEYEAPFHHIKPGTVLKQKYLIGRALGEGGFGITYIGRDLTLDMRIAVKEFFPSGYSHRNHNYTNAVTLTQNTDGNDFGKEMQRFLNEARMLAKFSDEQGIVGVRDFFQENGTAYIVMEYLDGITLKAHLQRFGAIPADKLFAMMDPVLVSLSRIHREGLIHRDISPDNIIVLKNGRLKLLDFGAAREFAGDKSLSVVLKPGYAPEEQYRSKGNQGPWTDVYAVCATMYKCITGITPDESLERVYEDSLQPPSKLGIAISPVQEAALMQGLRVKAQERTQDIDTLRQNLQAAGNAAPMRNIHIQRQSEDIGANDADEEKTVFQPAAADTGKTVYAPDAPDPSAARQSPETSGKSQPSSKRLSAQKREPKSAKPVQPAHKKRSLLPVIGCGGVVLIAVILICVFLLGGSREQITTVPGHDSYSLEKIGQLYDENRSISISNHVISKEESDNRSAFHFLNYLGEDTTNESYRSAKYLGYGLYMVTKDSSDVNSTGLISSTGEVLIPAEACLIEWPYLQEERNCQYLVVYYAEKEASPEEKALVCVTENGGIYSSDVGGTLYTGYTKIFDLAQKQFVGDLQFPVKSSSIQICGSNIVVGNSSIGYTLYNAQGNVLLQSSSTVYVGDGTLVAYSNGTYHVYDENGTQTYFANNNLSLIGYSPYIKTKSGDQYIAMDRNGTPVLQTAYSNIPNVFNGNFIVEQKNAFGLVSPDGTEILPCKYEYISNIYRIDEIGEAFYYAKKGNKYTLVCPDGIIMTNLSASSSKLILFQGSKALVLNNRSYDLDLGSARYTELTFALISVRSQDTGLYGVYDLFTGQQLLPYEYETIQYAAGYLYAFKNGAWEIYEVIHSASV